MRMNKKLFFWCLDRCRGELTITDRNVGDGWKMCAYEEVLLEATKEVPKYGPDGKVLPAPAIYAHCLILRTVKIGGFGYQDPGDPEVFEREKAKYERWLQEWEDKQQKRIKKNRKAWRKDVKPTK